MACIALATREDLTSRAWWKTKLYKHHLPIGFFLAVVLALAWPWPGATLSGYKVHDERIVPTIALCIIFLIAGLLLNTDDLVASFKQPAALIYGFLAILLLTPMVGFLAVRIPFKVEQFATGLAVFCSVPTTLSSGVALVYAAYGNDAMALMLCVGTNLLGVVTVPFLLKIILSSLNGSVELNAVSLLVKLLLTILVPTLIGKALQSAFKKVREFGAAHKRSMTLASNVCLISIVWMTLSRAQKEIINTAFSQIMLLILSGIGLHVFYLAMNHVLARYLLQLPLREYKAALIMGSQKTLPVSVVIISYLNVAQFGRQGLITLPCIAGHVAQLFIDAYIVARMATAEEARRNAELSNASIITIETISGGSDFPEEVRVTHNGYAPHHAGGIERASTGDSQPKGAKSSSKPAVAPEGRRVKVELATRSTSCPM